MKTLFILLALTMGFSASARPNPDTEETAYEGRSSNADDTLYGDCPCNKFTAPRTQDRANVDRIYNALLSSGGTLPNLENGGAIREE